MAQDPPTNGNGHSKRPGLHSQVDRLEQILARHSDRIDAIPAIKTQLENLTHAVARLTGVIEDERKIVDKKLNEGRRSFDAKIEAERQSRRPPWAAIIAGLIFSVTAISTAFALWTRGSESEVKATQKISDNRAESGRELLAQEQRHSDEMAKLRKEHLEELAERDKAIRDREIARYDKAIDDLNNWRLVMLPEVQRLGDLLDANEKREEHAARDRLQAKERLERDVRQAMAHITTVASELRTEVSAIREQVGILSLSVQGPGQP